MCTGMWICVCGCREQLCECVVHAHVCTGVWTCVCMHVCVAAESSYVSVGGACTCMHRHVMCLCMHMCVHLDPWHNPRQGPPLLTQHQLHSEAPTQTTTRKDAVLHRGSLVSQFHREMLTEPQTTRLDVTDKNHAVIYRKFRSHTCQAGVSRVVIWGDTRRPQ